MSLYIAGYETVLQVPFVALAAVVPAKWPGGQRTVSPVMAEVKSAEFGVLVTPADCGHDAVVPFMTQFPAGALAWGVPILLVITPDVARESLCAMVLLTMFTFKASCSEIPAPSQPATLLTIMLLVMATLCQRAAVD